MRKFILGLGVALFAVSFTACSDDDDNNDNNGGSIVDDESVKEQYYSGGKLGTAFISTSKAYE